MLRNISTHPDSNWILHTAWINPVKLRWVFQYKENQKQKPQSDKQLKYTQIKTRTQKPTPRNPPTLETTERDNTNFWFTNCGRSVRITNFHTLSSHPGLTTVDFRHDSIFGSVLLCPDSTENRMSQYVWREIFSDIWWHFSVWM
jgi:hypothetical protein